MRTAGGQARRGRFARALGVTVALASVALGAVAPAASAGTDAPALDEASLTARDLLATVPLGTRPTCSVGDATDGSAFAGYGPAASALVATLTCVPEGLDLAYYDQFADGASMQAAFETNFAATQGPSGFDQCPSRTDYKSGGKSAGVVACRIDRDDNGQAVATLAFTYAPTSTIVWAQATDPKAVWSFFDEGAGPLTAADYDEVAPEPTTTGLSRAASRLLARLPKQARRTCIPVSDLTPENLQSFYPYRLAIVADVEECRFDGGIEAEYFQLASTASADHLLSLSDFGGSPVAKYKTFSCPGSGSYKGGQWGCKITQPSTAGPGGGEEIATVAWTTDALRTYSYGQAPAADAGALLRWFVNSAGPNP